MKNALQIIEAWLWSPTQPQCVGIPGALQLVPRSDALRLCAFVPLR